MTITTKSFPLESCALALITVIHSFIYSVSGFNVVDDVYVSWKIASGNFFPQILCILI